MKLVLYVIMTETLAMTDLFSFQIEDEMIQCLVCEDWFHGRVRDFKN